MTALASPLVPLFFALSEISQVVGLYFLTRFQHASAFDVAFDKLLNRLAGDHLVCCIRRAVLRDPIARPCEPFDLDPFNRQLSQAVFFECESMCEISHIDPRRRIMRPRRFPDVMPLRSTHIKHRGLNLMQAYITREWFTVSGR